ncbi:MAG TPA: hypothetical protein PLL30_11145 [Candidatus Krumholzibacteria bacterium]|nr:hypothetical protein [Candidatus Krumholzibacteria bacterium]HPD72321.1 hypothetical protein [Candidatus Krumholzibacteria bacterium]HRY40747.1 hypothetical protein [Candidatus Krumholzibacteria bacterium]
MPVKICQECGAEYLPAAQVCADCGGKLVLKPEGDPNLVAGASGGARDQTILLGPHREALRLQQVLDSYEIEAVVQERADLVREGFRKIDPDAVIEPGIFEVLVRPDVRQRAEEIRDSLGLAASIEYEVEEFVEGQCPACGAPLAEEDLEECPDCGLSLAGHTPAEATEPPDDDDAAGRPDRADRP